MPARLLELQGWEEYYALMIFLIISAAVVDV